MIGPHPSREFWNTKLKTGLALVVLGIFSLAVSGLTVMLQGEVFEGGGFTAIATTGKTVPAFRYAAVALIGWGGILAGVGFLSTARRDQRASCAGEDWKRL
jgi:hypothetical protein